MRNKRIQARGRNSRLIQHAIVGRDRSRTPALSRANSDSTVATDIEDAAAINSLDSVIVKDASSSFGSAKPKKESLGPTSILGGELVSFIDNEDGVATAFMDSPEEMSFGPIEDLPQPSDTLVFGRRRALLIGCSYQKYPHAIQSRKVLKGPHNDVEEIKRLLLDVYDWGESNFRILKDDGILPEDQPTLANLRAEIRRFVEGVEPGDQLFFYFSGHGTQVTDTDWDEVDGKDEALIACDGGFLIDDELHEILVKAIPAGCRLTALFDCCSSGTALDLPFNLYAQRQTAFPGPGRSIVRRLSEGDVVLLSATEDSQTAYERPVGGKLYMMGELTRAFIKTMKSGRRNTYHEVITSVYDQFDHRKTLQRPQLSCSHEINVNEYFDL